MQNFPFTCLPRKNRCTLSPHLEPQRVGCWSRQTLGSAGGSSDLVASIAYSIWLKNFQIYHLRINKAEFTTYLFNSVFFKVPRRRDVDVDVSERQTRESPRGWWRHLFERLEDSARGLLGGGARNLAARSGAAVDASRRRLKRTRQLHRVKGNAVCTSDRMETNPMRGGG